MVKFPFSEFSFFCVLCFTSFLRLLSFVLPQVVSGLCEFWYVFMLNWFGIRAHVSFDPLLYDTDLVPAHFAHPSTTTTTITTTHLASPSLCSSHLTCSPPSLSGLIAVTHILHALAPICHFIELTFFSDILHTGRLIWRKYSLSCFTLKNC